MSHSIAPPGTPKATPEEIKERSARLLADPNHDRHAIAALIRSFRDQVISPTLASAVRVPTLGLVGSADPQAEALRKLRQLRPSVKLVVIEGGTHSGNGDVRKRPEFVRAIRDFVARGGRSE